MTRYEKRRYLAALEALWAETMPPDTTKIWTEYALRHSPDLTPATKARGHKQTSVDVPSPFRTKGLMKQAIVEGVAKRQAVWHSGRWAGRPRKLVKLPGDDV